MLEMVEKSKYDSCCKAVVGFEGDKMKELNPSQVSVLIKKKLKIN